MAGLTRWLAPVCCRPPGEQTSQLCWTLPPRCDPLAQSPPLPRHRPQEARLSWREAVPRGEGTWCQANRSLAKKTLPPGVGFNTEDRRGGRKPACSLSILVKRKLGANSFERAFRRQTSLSPHRKWNSWRSPSVRPGGQSGEGGRGPLSGTVTGRDRGSDWVLAGHWAPCPVGGDPGTALAQDPPGSLGAGSLRPPRPRPHRRAAFSGVTDDTPGTL